MKAKLFALFIVILMIGCGSPDSDVPEAVVISPQTDDPKTPPVVTDVDRNTLLRILDTGINADKIQRRGKEGEELYYKPNEESPYTGWIIAIYDDLVQQEYVMQVKDGKRDGLYCEWNRDGSKYRSTTYKKGVKNGLLTSYYNNGGKLLEINFMNGKEDGLMTTWYQNGQKEKEENFKEGKQDGVVTTWYENGQIKFKGASKDGKKDGVVTSWYENGQIRMKRDYKTGKLMITEVWKPTGEKCPESNIVNGNGIELTYGPEGTAEERTTYKNGEVQLREDAETFNKRISIISEAIDASTLNIGADGIYYAPDGQRAAGWVKSMFKNGQISSLVKLKDGKQDGTMIRYNADGTEKQRVTFKDGILDGAVIYYNADGTEKKRVTFKDGKPVED